MNTMALASFMNKTMKAAAISVLCTLACASICTAGAETAEIAATNRLALTVSPKMSKVAHVAHTPYSRSQTLNIRYDLDETIRKREVDYTRFWVETLLQQKFQPEITEGNIQALAGIEPKGDDGILLRWASDGYVFEALDSRAFTLVVQKSGLHRSNVIDIFKTLVNYTMYSTEHLARVESLEIGHLDGIVSYGQISVEKAGGWLSNPIEWYRDGDTLLFVFDKLLKLPPSKVPYTTRDATRFVGGTRWDEKQRFLMFENSNRKQLAEERFKKDILDKLPKTVIDNRKTKGRAVGSTPE